MEVRVRERLIGALVLVAIVVLVVPAILTGRGARPTEPSADTRRVEMPADNAPPAPAEQVLVPEPVPERPAEAPDATPAAPPQASREAPPPASDPSRRAVAAPTPAASAPAASKAAPRPAEAPAASAPPTATAWAVQLGAFSNRTKAEQLVTELKRRRYAAFILEYRASGQVLYRVRVGPEQDRSRAEEIAARLAKDGFQPVVARHP